MWITRLLLVLISLCVTVFSAELKKDVVSLPSIHGDFSPSSTPVRKNKETTIPMAWIAGEINKNPLKQISICAWIKSVDQSGTGTIFAYVTSDEKVEFGLVGVNTKQGNKNNDVNPHEVYVVIKGKRSNIPIDLQLDDVRWHHVCITWSSRYGMWKVYKDGDKIEQGLGLKRGRMIAPSGRYYLGGGVFKWLEEEDFVNGSSISQNIQRVSTGFTTGRKKRSVVSTETKRLIGKVTDFYIWNKIVSKAQISAMSKCSFEFRRHFNNEVKSKTSYANIFRTMRRKSARKSSTLSWAARNVLYAWNVDTITLQRPAILESSSDLCGYQISIECETNRMLISVDMEVTEWYNARGDEIHLIDHKCIPEPRGNYWVFHLTNMEACGTKRQVIDREVHYINTVSNTPRVGEVYIGQLFKAETTCKFPLDVTASAASLVPGIPPEVVDKTTVTNPKTGEPDLEAVFVLSTDDKFTDPLRQGNTLSSSKSLWGGIAIEGTYRGEQNGDVNVVVDECWTEAEDERRPLVDEQGCDSPSTVIENGENPRVKVELDPSDIRPNVPTFIGCSFHPCVGPNCRPNCEENNRLGGERRRRQRDTIEDEVYEVRVGPFIVIEEDASDTTIIGDEENTEERSHQLFLLAVILPSVMIFILLLSIVGIISYCCSRKTRRVHHVTKRFSDRGSKNKRLSERGSKKSQRPVRTQSFTFCRPSYSAYNVYPPSFHAIVRAKLQSGGINDVIEENDVNTNTMISTVG